MKLNIIPFSQIDENDKKLTVVTKYFNKTETENILNQTQDMKSFYALGENRIDVIKEKNLPRDFISFIGNIQSRRIPEIVKHCSSIQTVTTIKHLSKISDETIKQGFAKMPIFIQVNVSVLDKKSGIDICEFEKFYNQAKEFTGINIVGISAIGAGAFEEKDKRCEFEKLIEIKKKYPQLQISAGTSRDYEIGLEYDIDIFRLGSILYEE